ncbi:hypothetical protein SASPL_115344 [Salvia splendens]|uniref:Uncharacterized protein n=1 Tax=Salvia splendens TaxID=180675 RepID=A0A8X8Y857_SALSN|nr:hypothetical protein SASPL_115344 [Salvia splendens]
MAGRPLMKISIFWFRGEMVRGFARFSPLCGVLSLSCISPSTPHILHLQSLLCTRASFKSSNLALNRDVNRLMQNITHSRPKRLHYLKAKYWDQSI